MPDRTLYLFDTFDGFDVNDVMKDENLGKKEAKLNSYFRDISVEYVLSAMPHRGKCIIKKGYFPDTFDLENEEFAFVSIDADLYSPIKSGLEIFYPRLVKGGYIMVHDYNTIAFKGATKAVMEYCDAKGISYVPIPDICGSVVITK